MDNSSSHSNLDWILLLTSIALILSGFVFVYTLSSSYSEKLFDYPFIYINQHLTGLGLTLITSIFVYRFWSVGFVQKYSVWFFITSVFLIILTLAPLTSRTLNGASRWINFEFTNLFALPLATLLFLLFISSYLSTCFSHNKIRSLHSVVIVFVASILTLLLTKQPDFGGAFVIYSLVIILCFASRLYKLSVLLTIFIILFTVTSIISSPYRANSFFGYMNPFEDIFDTGYQLSISLSAIGGGDYFGVGFGEGILNREKFPGAFENFSFASIIEEFGFLGAMILLFCLAIISWRCLRLTFQLLNSDRKFEALLVLGIACWMLLTGFLHIASNLGLVPTVYMPLPFISYSPSYLFSFIIGIVIIIKIGTGNVSAQSPQPIPKVIVAGILFIFVGIGYSTFSSAVLDKELDYRYNKRVGFVEHAINKQREKHLFK